MRRTRAIRMSIERSGDEALSMLESDQGAYDLVITDQSMPRMRGIELADRIAHLSPAAPVVLYTGTADDIACHELESARVKELVRKPVEPFELRAIVARFISR